MVSLQDHDYPRSLITAWTIIERLLDLKWSEYMKGHRKVTIEGEEISFINSDRLKKLEGRDYTASVRTEVLSLLGILSFEVYKDMENIRKVRNGWMDGWMDGWMHELKQVKMSDARDAIKVVSILFESAYKVVIPKGLSLSL
jgi:hypothetical protein